MWADCTWHCVYKSLCTLVYCVQLCTVLWHENAVPANSSVHWCQVCCTLTHSLMLWSLHLPHLCLIMKNSSVYSWMLIGLRVTLALLYISTFGMLCSCKLRYQKVFLKFFVEYHWKYKILTSKVIKMQNTFVRMYAKTLSKNIVVWYNSLQRTSCKVSSHQSDRTSRPFLSVDSIALSIPSLNLFKLMLYKWTFWLIDWILAHVSSDECSNR